MNLQFTFTDVSRDELLDTVDALGDCHVENYAGGTYKITSQYYSNTQWPPQVLQALHRYRQQAGLENHQHRDDQGAASWHAHKDGHQHHAHEEVAA